MESKKKIIQMKGNGQRYSIQTEMTKQGLQFSYHTKWTLKQDYKDKDINKSINTCKGYDTCQHMCT